MDWTLARERNLAALLRVLALLFDSLGLSGDRSVGFVPRHLHSWALRILRPAESALRRLIVVEARELRVAAPVRRAAPVAGVIPHGGAGAAVPRFTIIEPLQRVGFAKPPVAKGYGPRISFFDGFDPVRETPKPVLPDDLVDAGRLCRRLLAARSALEALPEQALRLARWRARRDAGILRSPRTRVLRPGRPPGHREKGKREVDTLLAQLDDLAIWILHDPPPDWVTADTP